MKVDMNPRLLLAAIVSAVTAGACGGGNKIEGTYVATQESFIQSLTFNAEGQLDVVMLAIPQRGMYTVEGGTVTIVAPDGTRTPFQIASNGCLQGPVLLGTYCKGAGSASASPAADAAPSLSSNAGSADSGDWTGTYEAGTPEGSIVMEFQGSDKVLFRTIDTAGSPTGEAVYRYETHGDSIAIYNKSNDPMTLRHNGDALEGSVGDEPIRFNRR